MDLTEFLKQQKDQIADAWGGSGFRPPLIEVRLYDGVKKLAPESPQFIPYADLMSGVSDESFLYLAAAWSGVYHCATSQLEWCLKNRPWLTWATVPSAVESEERALQATAVEGACQWLRCWWHRLYDIKELTTTRLADVRRLLLEKFEDWRSQQRSGVPAPEVRMSIDQASIIRRLTELLDLRQSSDPRSDVLTSEAHYFGCRLMAEGWVRTPKEVGFGWRQAKDISRLLRSKFVREHSVSVVDRLERVVSGVSSIIGGTVDDALSYIGEHATTWVAADSEHLRVFRDIAPHVSDGVLRGGILQDAEVRRLTEAGWPNHLKAGDKPSVSLLFGDIVVYGLSCLKSDRKTINASDLCDEHGSLLPYTQALDRLEEQYNEFEDDSEFQSFVSSLTPAVAGAFCQVFDSEFGDRSRLSDAEADSWLPDLWWSEDWLAPVEDYRQFTSLTFSYEYACYQMYVWDDVGCEVDASDLAKSIAVRRLIDGYDDCYGGCWLRYRGLIADGEMPRMADFKDLSSGLKDDYIDWCEEAVDVDGWAHGLASYDGCGYLASPTVGDCQSQVIWWRTN